MTLTCSKCNKVFDRDYITSNQYVNRYCSKTCHDSVLRKKILVSCAQCGKEFMKSRAQLRRHPRSFCNKSCAASWKHAHKTIGYRRSKIEIYVENQLKLDYPNLEIVFNNRKIIGYELDIYIPNIGIAIEINGPTHYDPIYGTEVLERTRRTDKLKQSLCNDNGIKLFTVEAKGKDNNKYYQDTKIIIDRYL